MPSLNRRAIVLVSATTVGALGTLVVASPAAAATTLAATGSSGLPTWVPIVGGIVLLLGVAAVVFSVINRRKTGPAAAAAGGTATAGEPGPGTGGDAVFPEASTQPPTAQPPAENDPR